MVVFLLDGVEEVIRDFSLDLVVARDFPVDVEMEQTHFKELDGVTPLQLIMSIFLLSLNDL
jgi:hypothetical protein